MSTLILTSGTGGDYKGAELLIKKHFQEKRLRVKLEDISKPSTVNYDVENILIVGQDAVRVLVDDKKGLLDGWKFKK